MIVINRWPLKGLTPIVAKHTLCVAHAILSFILVAWSYSRGHVEFEFIIFSLVFLILFIRGVLWANFLMQVLLILAGLFLPFAIFYAHGFNQYIHNQKLDYTEAWIRVFLLEIACIGMVLLLRKSKPAFERFL